MTLHREKKIFYRLIFTSVILNTVWAFLSSILEFQLQRINYDSDLVFMGLGFILIYALTFFLYIPVLKRTFKNWLLLTLGLSVIFIIATFAVPIVFVAIGFEYYEWVYLFFSSLLASFAIVSVVGHHFEIHRKGFTIGLMTVAAFSAILLFFYTPITSGWFESPASKRIIHPLAIGYCIWQILTTTIIGWSIYIRKPSHNTMFAKQ